MLEWLRIWLLKPAMELILLCPVPWRYGLILLVPLILLFLLSPIGFIHRLLMWIAVGVLTAISWLMASLQSFCANRPPSPLIDTIDNSTEWVLRHSQRTTQSARARTALSLHWGRPKLWLILLLALLPVAAWYARPGLGNITVARGIDSSFKSIHSFEGWTLTSRWAANNNPGLEPASPSTPAAASSQDSPSLTPTVLGPLTNTSIGEAGTTLEIGGSARIVNTNGKGLRARSAPTSNSTILARFAEGSIVQIIDGPQDADGYTWWKVKGESDEGWCAADFLARES